MHPQDLPRPFSWKQSLNTPPTFYLVILLLQSVSLIRGGQTGNEPCDNFVRDLSHIRTNVSCKINNTGNGNAEINVSWFLIPEQAAGKIITSNLFETFRVFCDCPPSSNFTNEESDYDSKSIGKHSMQFSNLNLSCYDKCSCFVDFNTHCSVPNPRSDPSTCHSGPTVPKAPPVIISPPVRNFSNDENSVQVNFKLLPPVNLYCGSSIVVNITQNDNESHQYPKSYNRPLSTLHNYDDGNYTFRFKFPVEQFQFWTPFDIAISVKNSAGLSPFSSYMTIGKDDNSIPKDQYKFLCHFNDELSTLYLYWNLSVKAKSMWNSHFITGFHFTMEELGDNSHNIMTYLMNNTNLTLNVSLKSNEWYLLVGRILLEDSEIYGPEPSYVYFKTPAATNEHSSSSDDHKYYIIVMSISVFLTMIVILLIAYFKIRFKKPSHDYVQLSVHCDNEDDDYNSNDHRDGDHDHDDHIDDDDNDSSVKMRALGSLVGSSYVERANDPSVVENL